jgi:hypothetical protein
VTEFGESFREVVGLWDLNVAEFRVVCEKIGINPLTSTTGEVKKHISVTEDICVSIIVSLGGDLCISAERQAKEFITV